VEAVRVRHSAWQEKNSHNYGYFSAYGRFAPGKGGGRMRRLSVRLETGLSRFMDKKKGASGGFSHDAPSVKARAGKALPGGEVWPA